MKRDKIIYWATTGLVSLAMTAASFMYLTQNPQLIEGFKSIGLPLYLAPLLGITKLLGAIAIAVPNLKLLKEWAYAGFTFMFVGATWVHVSTHTPFVSPLIFLALLGVSYWFKNRIEIAKS